MGDLSQFGELNRAERAFAEACQAGEACELGDGSLPPADAGPERTIRGTLLRWFALGGDATGLLHEKGVNRKGALISEHLDLSGSTNECDLSLQACRFACRPRLQGTHMRAITLSGSALPGLAANGLRLDGALVMADGFEAKGPVNLIRARIGADLDCRTATFEAPEDDALNADGAEIGGSVFLMGQRDDDDKIVPFRCRGTARFVSVTVGDSFMVLDASFDSGSKKYALNLALGQIRRQLTLKNFVRFDGRLNLSGASTYSLNDDPKDPNAPKNLILNGFEYVHFSAKAPMDVTTRLTWLARQNPADYGQDFWLQPYSHFARVLGTTGHEGDARQVLVEKEKRQGEVSLRNAARAGRWPRYMVTWLADRFMRYVVGYGYRPQMSLIWMAGVLVATSWFFQQTYAAGDMTPAAAPILVSSGWQNAVETAPVLTAQEWGRAAGKDYETFHPVAYAFDLFVPLVDIGQQSAWGPSTERGQLGRIGWWLRWVIEIIGWVITALAVAAVTGLVRRD